MALENTVDLRQIGAMRTSLLFVIICCAASTVYGDCERPTGGPNMQLITDLTFPVPDSTSVTFTCEIGHQRFGSGAVVCSGEQWSSLKMKCERKNCGSAGDVLNGQIDYSEGTEFGAMIHVVCNEGYVVVGLGNQLYCGDRGWEGRLPECEVLKCDSPPAVLHGSFTPFKEDYEHSEVITYSCEKDYILNGSRTASCQDNGFHPAPPTCVSVNCVEPLIDNGVQVAGSRFPFKYQSTVTFRCNSKYYMEGKDTVSCDINSKWSPPLPKCMPITCDTPVIKDGEVDNPRPTYKYGDTLTVKCAKGYELSGQETLTCGEGKQWSPALPKCTSSGGSAVKIVFGILGGAVACLVIGCCVYFGLVKKRKGDGKEYTGAPQDADNGAPKDKENVVLYTGTSGDAETVAIS